MRSNRIKVCFFSNMEYRNSLSTVDRRSVIILAIVINAFHRIDAKLNVIPRDTEVKINDTTYMNCTTSLQTDLVQWRHGKYYVYTGIAILEPYGERFSVEINASTGACNLVIRSVQPSDAGKYDCSEDARLGETRSAQLIVLDAHPVCKSNMHSDGVIGANSCGIEPEEIKLSCSITYYGNTLPILQWNASGDNQSITDGLFSVTSVNNEVTYTLTMKSTLALNNASFICETTRTSDKHYTCSSNAINILYVFSSEVTINMTMNDKVSCFANTSQTCSYKWKWFSGDDVTTESDNQILKPKKVGWHRCEATCSVLNKSCIVKSMHAKVYSDAGASGSRTVEDKTSKENRLQLLALLLFLIPAVAVPIAIHYLRKSDIEKSKQKIRELKGKQQRAKLRLLEYEAASGDTQRDIIRIEKIKQWIEELQIKLMREKYKLNEAIERKRIRIEERYRQLEDEQENLLNTEFTHESSQMAKYRENPELVRKIALGHSVWGLAILNKELFVASADDMAIFVYDTVAYELQRTIDWEGARGPRDIVACDQKNCLFAVDLRSGLSLFCIDQEGEMLKQWEVPYEPHNLSVMPSGNILLTCNARILIYNSEEGNIMQDLILDAKALDMSWQTILLRSGNYLVCQGWMDSKHHRVLSLSNDGVILKSFGSERQHSDSHLSNPVYMAIDRDEIIFVADSANNRVVRLSQELVFLKEQLNIKDGVIEPYRVLLDEASRLLYVGTNYRQLFISMF